MAVSRGRGTTDTGVRELQEQGAQVFHTWMYRDFRHGDFRHEVHEDFRYGVNRISDIG